jgi:hypothetical protein
MKLGWMLIFYRFSILDVLDVELHSMYSVATQLLCHWFTHRVYGVRHQSAAYTYANDPIEPFMLSNGES